MKIKIDRPSHCPSETLLNGMKCRWIKHGVHCHPENFKKPADRDTLDKAPPMTEAFY
jgi:hypothetical protein